MKKIYRLVVILCSIIILTGCLGIISPSNRVAEMFNKYINNDSDVTQALEDKMAKQDLTESQKERYKKIIKNEYTNIKYKIINENIIGTNADVEVNITVRDLYKANEKAESELVNNPTKFYTDGVYDARKFIDYKLDVMESFDETVNYTIIIHLYKSGDVWIVDDLDNETLEKIHGVYSYMN